MVDKEKIVVDPDHSPASLDFKITDVDDMFKIDTDEISGVLEKIDRSSIVTDEIVDDSEVKLIVDHRDVDNISVVNTEKIPVEFTNKEGVPIAEKLGDILNAVEFAITDVTFTGTVVKTTDEF